MSVGFCKFSSKEQTNILSRHDIVVAIDKHSAIGRVAHHATHDQGVVAVGRKLEAMRQ